MRSSIVKMTAIAALAALSAGTAKADIISNTYTVAGSNFLSTVTPPFATITESFTISFNNAVTVSQQTTGISLNPSTITPTSPLAFTYIAGVDTLIVGGTAATVTTTDPGSTDFALVINNASNPATFSITSLSYSTGQGTVFTATTTSKPAPASVPEPASLAVLGTVAAAFGFMRRRKA